MFVRRMLVTGIVVLASLLLPTQSFAELIFQFEYSMPAGGLGPIVAQGYLMTGDYDSGLGGYQIQGITGTRTLNGVEATITGLLGVNEFYNSNILYYPGQPYLGYFGLGFTIDQVIYSDDGKGDVEVFFDSRYSASNGNTLSAYTEAPVVVGYGDFQVQEVPEPGAWGLGLAGCATIAMVFRRYRRGKL